MPSSARRSVAPPSAPRPRIRIACSCPVQGAVPSGRWSGAYGPLPPGARGARRAPSDTPVTHSTPVALAFRRGAARPHRPTLARCTSCRRHRARIRLGSGPVPHRYLSAPGRGAGQPGRPRGGDARVSRRWRPGELLRQPGVCVPAALARQLSPWIQLLFQDAKAIRAQHLGRLGSASYGSQVRRLLGDEPARGATLLIGAGHLAQSVAPWLGGAELWLYNRTTERALELSRELAKRDAARPVRVLEGGLAAELAAWRSAQHVVVCIPGDAALDAARVAARRDYLASAPAGAPGRVIHLGLGAAPPAPWSELPGVVSLCSLFDM